MPLNRDEIEKLIRKLREKYSEYAEKKSASWFNLPAFEERLNMALANKMNLEGFILAEIANFEKLQEGYRKKSEPSAFSLRVDRIIEENTARMEKYPAVEFHVRSGYEISHFYGAVSEFVTGFLPVLRIVIDDAGLRDELAKLENSMEYLAMPRGELPSRRVESHSLILSRRGVKEIEVERDKNEFLKETAFVLHDIIDFCDGLISKKKPEWENPLLMNRLYLEEQRRKRVIELFSGHTGYGAIIRVREQALNIISDFRLNAFRKK